MSYGTSPEEETLIDIAVGYGKMENEVALYRELSNVLNKSLKEVQYLLDSLVAADKLCRCGEVALNRAGHPAGESASVMWYARRRRPLD